MSDFHETALLKYEEEQDQLHREELEREQNPKKYWLITTSDWYEYANTEEEKQEFIDLCRSGLRGITVQSMTGSQSGVCPIHPLNYY